MRVDGLESKGIEPVLSSFVRELYGVALCRTHNHSDSEDIVQDVIVKLFQAGDDLHFKSAEHLKHWLLRVTINRCNDYWRVAMRHPWISLDRIDESAILYDNEDESFDLAFLHPKNRQILRLYYYEGFTFSEIANMLSISESAVRKRLSRARQELRKRLVTQ